MKSSVLLILSFILFSAFSINAQDKQTYFQLKIYSFENETQLIETEAFMKDAYLPALKRNDIKSIGVFKQHLDKDTLLKLFVLIPFNSLTQPGSVEAELTKDKVFQKDGRSYLQAPHNKAPYSRIESVLLKAFKNMPQLAPCPLTGPRSERIYELRSYESATEEYFKRKVDMFNDGGEMDIFTNLGFNAVFYAEVISGAHMPNLMYMTTHTNTQIRESNWKKFGSSPAWAKLKVQDKYANTVSHIDKWFLYPTEYSDY